ncbi:MAG: hypothetical protein GTO18_04995, partial [Anaerolineales bacterium]|nr:hypothetical protein [Anaerolineales bacterium]
MGPRALLIKIADVPLWEWFANWTAGLWEDRYTAGCSVDPLLYCPFNEHTNAEGCVFYLRMLNGAEYLPSEPTGIFADVPVDEWYAPWEEEAYHAGILMSCQETPELLACPMDPLTRAMAAYVMVQAKNLQ